VRLARFVRDRGTVYFRGNPLGDGFLAPARCYEAGPPNEVRWLIPVGGAGLRADGTRSLVSEYDDYDHCLDVSSISAAGLAALRRDPAAWKRPGPPPFATEGASLLALHHELLACAYGVMVDYERPRRDPRAWSARDLADGVGQADFISKNKIGWPTFNVSPQRKYGWWFNSSIEGLALVLDAGLDFATLRPGGVQPANAGCEAARFPE